MSSKIIGIYGKSGAGKSTAAKYLSEKLENAKVIEVDRIHINYLLTQQKDKLINMYGEDIIINGKLNTTLFIAFPEKQRLIFDESFSELETICLKEIEDANKSYEYIIIAFFRLVSLKKIWNTCQYRILIEAINDDKRFENIALRYVKMGENITRTREEEVKLRDYFLPNFNKYKHDFHIINSYNKNFEKDLDNVVKEISDI